MNRRGYISSVPLMIALSGCITDSQNAQSDPETDEPDPSEDLFTFISNDRDEQISASLTVMDRNCLSTAEKRTVLDPEESVEVYTGITETGEYPYTFSLNGEQQFEYTYNVDSYRLQAGLDISISVEDEDVAFSAED